VNDLMKCYLFIWN